MPSARKLAQQQAKLDKSNLPNQPIGYCKCGRGYYSKYEFKTHTCRVQTGKLKAAE